MTEKSNHFSCVPRPIHQKKKREKYKRKRENIGEAAVLVC